MSRIEDALRAEHNGNHLSVDGNGRILILGETSDGKFYKLGHVSQELFYQKAELAIQAISAIQFYNTRRVTSE